MGDCILSIPGGLNRHVLPDGVQGHRRREHLRGFWYSAGDTEIVEVAAGSANGQDNWMGHDWCVEMEIG